MVLMFFMLICFFGLTIFSGLSQGKELFLMIFHTFGRIKPLGPQMPCKKVQQ